MTVPAETATPSPSSPGHDSDRQEPAAHPAAVPHLPAREATGVLCPYLASDGGSWRSAVPSRDHRCIAVDPPAPQATDKQRRHCLSADHVDCPLFRAARTARTTSLAAGSDPRLIEAADERRRAVARTAPVVLEAPRLVDGALRLQLDRTPGQVALVGLMLIAFAVVAIARFSAGGVPGASPTVDPSSIAVASAPPSPSPTPAATPTASVDASASPGPSPSFRTTYTVKKGDTLSGIATRYKTTAAKIRALNGLKSNTLKVGQVLKIP